MYCLLQQHNQSVYEWKGSRLPFKNFDENPLTIRFEVNLQNVCACVCVCVYACMHAYVHACMHAYVHACMCACDSKMIITLTIVYTHSYEYGPIMTTYTKAAI